MGARLLLDVARWCAWRAPGEGLHLYVLQSNGGAQRFYERHGARRVGADVWHPPGGGRAPCYRYAWAPAALAARAAISPR